MQHDSCWQATFMVMASTYFSVNVRNWRQNTTTVNCTVKLHVITIKSDDFTMIWVPLLPESARIGHWTRRQFRPTSSTHAQYDRDPIVCSMTNRSHKRPTLSSVASRIDSRAWFWWRTRDWDCLGSLRSGASPPRRHWSARTWRQTGPTWRMCPNCAVSDRPGWVQPLCCLNRVIQCSRLQALIPF